MRGGVTALRYRRSPLIHAHDESVVAPRYATFARPLKVLMGVPMVPSPLTQPYPRSGIWGRVHQKPYGKVRCVCRRSTVCPVDRVPESGDPCPGFVAEPGRCWRMVYSRQPGPRLHRLGPFPINRALSQVRHMGQGPQKPYGKVRCVPSVYRLPRGPCARARRSVPGIRGRNGALRRRGSGPVDGVDGPAERLERRPG